jgi:hypothetical protein
MMSNYLSYLFTDSALAVFRISLTARNLSALGPAVHLSNQTIPYAPRPSSHCRCHVSVVGNWLCLRKGSDTYGGCDVVLPSIVQSRRRSRTRSDNVSAILSSVDGGTLGPPGQHLCACVVQNNPCYLTKGQR